MDPHRPLYPHALLAELAEEAAFGEDERLYYRETRYVLDEIAQWLEAARAAGALRNAAVVLVADHGDMFVRDGHDIGPVGSRQQRKLRGHGHALYEELVHVPLVVAPPGADAGGGDVWALVSHVDLHDTLAELLGVDLPSSGDDRVSVAAWLRGDGQAAPVRRYALLSSSDQGPVQLALRARAEKLIVFTQGVRPAELYDLAHDAGERHNLAESAPGRLAPLETALEAFAEDFATSARAAAGSPIEFSPEAREQLEALGYVE
jgi:arylsulfatase A-like enzyme